MKLVRLIPLFALLLSTATAQLPEGLVDTQDPSTSPPSPEESLEMITVPDGFQVSLFAGEPDVAQPIAINYDDRGRLWVVESFSYIEWKDKGQDRILIFEDSDNDGRFDSRKVFWDKGNHLSGFQIGHGGVWVCDAPNLLFIPDANRDDVPDSEPQVMLDGWALDAEHNFFNGLTWGPDGWLYGRHGIKKPSHVGKPGTPTEERIELSCSIWRFHPVRHEFEVYADGTVNPWGLDWNEEGQPFINTSVVDHLWHLVPGARFARWEGRGVTHPNPHTYDWMRPTSDHRHWVGGEQERKTYTNHDEAGGGHSHCGMVIYQADSWPEEYQGRAFFSNVLGQRLNMDHLARSQSGYVASHGNDFLKSSSEWFRAVDLKQGPHGEMMVAEWTDLGECHDRDGIHRTSGRLYRVWHGDSPKPETIDVAALDTKELLSLLQHENVWWRRHALRNLYERAASGEQLTEAQLGELMNTAKSGSVRDAISAIDALHAMDNTNPSWPREIYDSNRGSERDAIRAHLLILLFTEKTPDADLIAWLENQIPDERSPLVHLAMAAALQRIPVESRWKAASLVSQLPIPESDENLVIMTWYGLEPTVETHTGDAVELALADIPSFLATSIARRGVSAGALDTVLAGLKESVSSANAQDVLEGILLALPSKVEMPASWPALYASIQAQSDKAAQAAAARLAIRFGDTSAEQELVTRVMNPELPKQERIELLDLLSSAKSPSIGEKLWSLVEDPELGPHAIRALTLYPAKDTAPRLLELFASTKDRDLETTILQTLAARKDFADALVQALRDGDIAKERVPTYVARQLATVASEKKQFAEFWGLDEVNTEQKAALLAKWKDRLPEHYLANADPAHGREVFLRTCSACHQLYNEGGQIGPNLTGSNRANLDYFLLSVLFPGEDVSEDYKLVTMSLKDGRMLAGSVIEENEEVLIL